MGKCAHGGSPPRAPPSSNPPLRAQTPHPRTEAAFDPFYPDAMNTLTPCGTPKNGTGPFIAPPVPSRRPWFIHRLRSRSQKAFSLVELTLAMGVSSFCLLSILGVLPVGLESNHNSRERTAAASLARGIVADLRALAQTSSQTSTPSLTSSPQYALQLSRAFSEVYLAEDGTTLPGKENARYLATVKTDAASPTAFVNIRITWPAAAAADKAHGFYETATAIGRN